MFEDFEFEEKPASDWSLVRASQFNAAIYPQVVKEFTLLFLQMEFRALFALSARAAAQIA